MTAPATVPHAAGVLVIDDSGDRKAGTKPARVARQYLGWIGKVDGGIVAVTSLWADERIYYPLHVQPYTPAERLPKGKADPDFPTKPQLAAGLVDVARDAGFSFRAVVAHRFYGENATFEGALLARLVKRVPAPWATRPPPRRRRPGPPTRPLSPHLTNYR